MTNLFSIFDPSSGLFSLNWLSCFFFMFMFPYKYWFLLNNITSLFNFILKNIYLEVKNIIPLNSMLLMMVSLFLMILSVNLFGLLPYVFTPSSHLVFSLSMGLPLWLSFMFFGWLTKTNMMFCHLVPLGTPSILMPFMVVIESISMIIRPISLSVRLTANMIAGHLLMSLLGGSGLSLYLLSLLLFFYIILMVFETAVSIIQSYVFMTLTSLYSGEV